MRVVGHRRKGGADANEGGDSARISSMGLLTPHCLLRLTATTGSTVHTARSTGLNSSLGPGRLEQCERVADARRRPQKAGRSGCQRGRQLGSDFIHGAVDSPLPPSSPSHNSLHRPRGQINGAKL